MNQSMRHIELTAQAVGQGVIQPQTGVAECHAGKCTGTGKLFKRLQGTVLKCDGKVF